MRVMYSSDGHVEAGHQGFAAVYSTDDPLTRIRQCELNELTLAYGDGGTRLCGVAANDLGGDR